MGLDFSKTTTAAAPAATVVPDTKDEIAVVEQYDIVAEKTDFCRRGAITWENQK